MVPEWLSFDTQIKMIKALVLLLALGCVCGDMPGIYQPDPECTPKIVNGQNANEGEFPYMISLRKKMNNNRHTCGGSILTKNWLVTAAHCCDAGDKNTLLVNTGTIYLDRGGSFHPIERIVKHPEYIPSPKWRNDICLIRVSVPFNFSSNVQQITVPPENWPVNDGDKLTVSGWGLLKSGNPDPPNRMQKAETLIALSNQKCGQITGTSMFPGYLCAIGGIAGQGVCNGDSGGPLVKNRVLVGVVSWGFRPCGCGKPDFYARVPHYISWFKTVLQNEFNEIKFLK